MTLSVRLHQPPRRPAVERQVPPPAGAGARWRCRSRQLGRLGRFAGIMMILVGLYQCFIGLVAIFNDKMSWVPRRAC